MVDAFNETVFDDGRGHALARREAQMLTIVVRGYAEEAMVHWYVRVFHAFVDSLSRKGDVFHDWTGVTGFSSNARGVFMKWGRERNAFNRSVCRGVHVLTEGTLVYLALEAASTFTRGYMTAYRTRRTFDLERESLSRRPSLDAITKIDVR